MIQRIQSIFIAFALINSIIGVLIFYNAKENFFLYQFNIKLEMFLGAILSIFLALISLFLFKNRKLQLMINLINLFLNLVLIVLFLCYLLNLSGGFLSLKKGVLAVPFVTNILLLVFANQYIKKDERLVKSVDRIR